MILKAGTYRFNNVATEIYRFEVDLPFTVDIAIQGATYTATCSKIRVNSSGGIEYYIESMLPMPEGFGPTWITVGAINAFTLEIGFTTEFGTSVNTLNINKDTEADDTFGTWYIANTNYNEVNAKPIATIEYNGQVIASLNAGETATLSCDGKRMASDVMVKVGIVGTKFSYQVVDNIGNDTVTQL